MNEEEARLQRLQALKDAGVDPYPARVERTHTVAAFLAAFDVLTAQSGEVTITGRLRTVRKHGGLTFAQLEDGSGIVQLVLHKDKLGEEAYAFFHATVDMGDFVEAKGGPFVTKKGERSLDVSSCRIIAKALAPMPEKWHGLTDVEIRFRRRELDLLSNESTRRIFRIRAAMLTGFRTYLDRHGFLEVETPMLQAVPGGASAKPFKTHHNALNTDLYLRVAPELYLKRCVVGGFERVYEVARCFRNEGIDHAHNPEFTQIEAYVAYMDYHELMDLVQGMIVEGIKAAGLDPKAVAFQGDVLDFASTWPRVTFREAMKHYAQLDIETIPDRESAAKAAVKLGVPVEKTDGYATIVDTIYKHLVRPNIVQPTYLIDYPAEITPLAKRKVEDPRYVEMFQLVYGHGIENVKAFSELNDPIDQEARFKEQEAARAAGDEDAQFGDQEYVDALKQGMPPTAGFGIGIDRFAATLADAHALKEVILFPTLRPLPPNPEVAV